MAELVRMIAYEYYFTELNISKFQFIQSCRRLLTRTIVYASMLRKSGNFPLYSLTTPKIEETDILTCLVNEFSPSKGHIQTIK
jgi:hypothetical protein